MRKYNKSGKLKDEFAGYNNRPHKIPDPKLLDENIEYALSINPSAQPIDYETYNETFKGDIRAYTNEILKVLRMLKNCHIEVHPEISSGGRWHYHGVIIIKDLALFLLYDMKIMKHYFSFELDTIKETKEWSDYCMKCSHFMEKYCTQNKMPYKITSSTKDLKVDKLQQGTKYEWKDTKDNNGNFNGQQRLKIMDSDSEDESSETDSPKNGADVL